MDAHEKTEATQTITTGPPGDESAPLDHPERIGRYHIRKILGRGGFGIVFLAEDDQLQRLVAIKVPYRDRISTAEEVAACLSEARTVANLDHPNIVPVHDVGSTGDYPCFIVSKFIEGCTLAQRIKDSRLSNYEATELTATVAEALHYAHRKGLVHRDIKPGNILIDGGGMPFVVDFGTALKLENAGMGPKFAGTPAYMSPEQACGQGHLVDGRSDIFSLGVVFYELLLGSVPFCGKSLAETLERIARLDPLPPRQVDDTIPRELERICLKALAKRPSERYTTARDFADDLRHFLEQAPEHEKFAQVITVGLVQRLLDAQIAQVPGIIREIEDYRVRANPLLMQEFARAGTDSRQKLHASMALLPVDATQVDYLLERLLQAEPAELAVIRTVLRPYQDKLVERLWQILDVQPHGEKGERCFRAACALASYDPGGDPAADRRWRSCAEFVAVQLLAAVQRNPSHYTPLLEALRPVRAKMTGPLSDICRNRKCPEAQQFFATSILAEYAADQPRILAELLMDADEKQFAVLYPKIEAHRVATVELFQKTAGSFADVAASEEEKERQATRQVNAAVALLRLGDTAKVWPLLEHRLDPRVRSYLIHRLGPMGSDPGVVVDQLERNTDPSIQRALVLSLSEFSTESWSAPARQQLVERLQRIYCTSADPGLHAAAGWLLRQWHQELWLKTADDRRARERDSSNEPGALWYINSQGQTIVVIPGPVEFVMGSPTTEAGRFDPETLHRRRIGRSFAIAATTVTVAQFRCFHSDYPYFRQYAPTEDCPVHQTTWYEAAEYCNWLSAQDGMPADQWCFEPNAQGQYAQGMKLKANYLSLNGYRLPTEAEWEYACRAGAATSRYYGESVDLLDKYGVRSSDLGRSAPVGSRKPNDFGLFDMHGNVWCWCLDTPRAYPSDGTIVNDTEGSLEVNNDDARVLRGGSFLNPAVTLRCAYRFGNVPANRSAANGFRVAQTIHKF